MLTEKTPDGGPRRTRTGRGVRLASVMAAFAVTAALIGWVFSASTPKSPLNTPDAVVSTPSHPPVTVGTSAAPPSPPSPRPADSVASSTEDTGSPATPEADLLDRVGRRPDGIPDQIEIFIGGDGGCFNEDPTGRPEIVTSGVPEELPDRAHICLLNFDQAKPLRVTLTPPVGPARTTTLPALDLSQQSDFGTSFLLSPSDPTGTYRVSAEQGDKKASNEIVAVRPESPKLWLDTPRPDVVAGDDIDIYLGGFPPGRPATLHLYGSDRIGQEQPYRTSFTVPVDADGAGHVVIDTKPDDGLGCYGFTTNAVRACRPDSPCPIVEFCITRNRG